MIELLKGPTDRVLELGCGDNPHPSADVRVDVRPTRCTDFTCDFTQPLPIGSDEFSAVLAHFVLEHLPYRAVPQFLKEILRVLRPGGTAVLAVPNTEAQLRWALDHPHGWDGKNFFDSASEKIFGSQNMPGEGGEDHNTHKGYFNPPTVQQLFQDAGFVGIEVRPYGARNTDQSILARKPTPPKGSVIDRTGEPHPLAGGLKHRGALMGNANLRKVLEGHPATHIPSPNVLGTNVARGPDGQLSPTPLQIRETAPDPEWDVMAVAPHPPAQCKNQGATPPATLLVGGSPGEAPESPADAILGDSGAAETEPGAVAMISKDRPNLAWAELPNGCTADTAIPTDGYDPEKMFTKHYFDGARGGWGGYGPPGYRDFPAHEVIARNVLARKPKSVLELGCGRGYVGKRLEDAGLAYLGLDVSRHCQLTAVCRNFERWDLCEPIWFTVETISRDLCFSISVLDHIPIEFLPGVVKEMARTCKRGLVGVNCEPLSDGDKTRLCAGRPLSWWKGLFETHSPGWPVEVLEKQALEQGAFPKEILDGDGRLKVNVGSFTNFTRWGWENLDVHDLQGAAQADGARFRRHDVRQGLPFYTAACDLIFAHHCMEHLTYAELRAFLKECRRVIRPEGAMRLVVPDADFLIESYARSKSGWNLSDCDRIDRLSDFYEINDAAEVAPTAAEKLYELLLEGHKCLLDEDTLIGLLEEAGFRAERSAFRQYGDHPGLQQLGRECQEMDFGGVSLFVNAVPRMDA